MGMVVRTNVMAMNANRSLGTNNTQVGKSLEKLSSGFRINRAADDASGLAISEKMKAQIKGLEQASANSQDGISLIQTAEGATQEIHNMLNRMVELATKSANGTIQNNVDREAIQKEVDDLNSEITRIASSTNFNGIKLLDGSLNAKSEVTGNLGATNVSFSTSSAVADLGSAHTVELKSDKTADKGINVTITADTGAVTIALGTKGTANTYTAEEITKAVRDKAASVAADSATAAADKTIAEKLSSFTMTSDSPLSFAAAATDVTTGALALANTAAGKGGLNLQVGDTNDSFNHVSVSVADLSASGLKINGLKVNTQEDAGNSIATIKTAINTVSTNRANLGSLQNRLEYTINNLDTTTENMTSANSRIRDTDMAKEMMNYTKMNILTQAAQAMLAQANQQPQAILQLLQ